MNLQEAIDKYLRVLAVEKGLSEDTIASYKSDLALFCRTFPEKQDTTDLYPYDLTEFAIRQDEEARAASTVARRLSALYRFFRFLADEELMEAPPDHPSRPKLPKRLPTALSFDEVEALLDRPDTSNESGARDKAMLETMYACGLRVSELVSLCLKDLNVKARIIVIRHGILIEEGPTEEVYEHPQQEYTRNLLDAFYYDKNIPGFRGEGEENCF